MQIGKVIEGPGEFYSARIPRKERGNSIVDQILKDRETRRFLKRKVCCAALFPANLPTCALVAPARRDCEKAEAVAAAAAPSHLEQEERRVHQAAQEEAEDRALLSCEPPFIAVKSRHVLLKQSLPVA